MWLDVELMVTQIEGHYPAVRTGSSNTPFFSVVFFFGGHLPQTSSFRSAKEILVVSFATQPRTFILSDRNIFYTPGGGRTTAGSNAPGAFLVTPPSGRGLVIPIFFPLVFFFFGGHLPQTSGFRSAKQILVVSFATQARAFLLSDRNIFYTPRGGGTTAGSNAPGAFLVSMCNASSRLNRSYSIFSLLPVIIQEL